jgi:hypothetical protein
MAQFKSWTLNKRNFSIADQRLTVRVREFYRTLVGLTPIYFASGSGRIWSFTTFGLPSLPLSL